MYFVDGRIVGIVAATLALVCLVLVALGLFTSPAGVVIAGAIAAVVGVGAGVLAEPVRVGRATAVVVGYVVILIVAYLMIGQVASRNAPGASDPRRGGVALLAEPDDHRAGGC